MVVYITTLGVLRETYARCVKVRQILRTLLIKVEERDVFMARDNQLELLERMENIARQGEDVDSAAAAAHNTLKVPQVFVEGRYFGVSATKHGIKQGLLISLKGVI